MTSKERVSSNYAEIYFNDSENGDERSYKSESENKYQKNISKDNEDWISPSDLIIPFIKINLPLTSNITRSKSHKGILSIGDFILKKEEEQFTKYLNKLIADNDAAWKLNLKSELERIKDKVIRIYKQLLQEKQRKMVNEINIFFEKSLQEIEDNLQNEIQHVLISSHANLVTDMKKEIRKKMKKEKDILEKKLKKKYNEEVVKIKKYYELILNKDISMNKEIINSVIAKRNESIYAFYKQIESKSITTSMYVMCTKRKKCKLKKILLQNILSSALKEILIELMQKEECLKNMTRNKITDTEVNQQWKEKLQKVLKLFLKFITFSLKLLPEQSIFLLDFHRICMLQLDELKKKSDKPISVLVDINDNMFKFLSSNEIKQGKCNKDPFIIEGDTTDIPPQNYSSSETLPSDVDLPLIRIQRQFVYAKCPNFNEIKKYLESIKCSCHEQVQTKISNTSNSSSIPDTIMNSNDQLHETIESQESLESLDLNSFVRYAECPAMTCQNWLKSKPFLDLESYIDYTEENNTRIKVILNSCMEDKHINQLLNPLDISNLQVPFEDTKYHNISTQYSSQIDIPMECVCIKESTKSLHNKVASNKLDNLIPDAFLKRQRSLRYILQNHPKLLKIFTDECFDFKI